MLQGILAKSKRFLASLWQEKAIVMPVSAVMYPGMTDHSKRWSSSKERLKTAISQTQNKWASKSVMRSKSLQAAPTRSYFAFIAIWRRARFATWSSMLRRTKTDKASVFGLLPKISFSSLAFHGFWPPNPWKASIRLHKLAIDWQFQLSCLCFSICNSAIRAFADRSSIKADWFIKLNSYRKEQTEITR